MSRRTWDEQAQRERFFANTKPQTHEIVELNGEPIGCLFVEDFPDAIELHRVFLLPGHQNRGTGTRLVTDVQQRAQEQGVPVRLRVFKVNPAQELYSRLGFVVKDETETHLVMEYSA